MALGQNSDVSSIVDAAFNDIYIESITRLWRGENELRRSKPYHLLRNLGEKAIPRIRQRIKTDSSPQPFSSMVLHDIIHSVPILDNSNHNMCTSKALEEVSILIDPSFETMFENDSPWKSDHTAIYIKSEIRQHGVQSVNLISGRVYQDFEAIENKRYDLTFQFYLPREFISADIQMQFEWFVGQEWTRGLAHKGTLKRQFEDSVGWYLSSCSDISPERATLGRVSVINPGQNDAKCSFLVDFAFLKMNSPK